MTQEKRQQVKEIVDEDGKKKQLVREANLYPQNIFRPYKDFAPEMQKVQRADSSLSK